MSFSTESNKKIRIRKEDFGYVLFDRHTREHHFVKTDKIIENMPPDEISDYLKIYFKCDSLSVNYEIIEPPAHAMELSAPIGMYIEITEKCIFSCNHCYKPELALGSLVSLDGFKKIIDELHSIGVFEIRLCGNEPTASPYFFELCQYIKDKNIYLGINTCGYFSHDLRENEIFISKLIDIAPDFVVVSVDGPPEIHDSIRRKGSWDRATYLLSKLSELNIPRRINSLISRSSIPHIEYIAELATQMSCGVSFLPLRSIGRETSLKNSDRLDRESMLESVRKITELRSIFPKTRMLTYFDILTENADYHHSMDFNKPCPARKNGFIAFDGSYFPCDFLRYLGERWCIGNVGKNTFWELWTSSCVLQEFRQLKHSKCQNCKFYMTNCYGGCISGAIACSNKPDDDLCFVDLI